MKYQPLKQRPTAAKGPTRRARINYPHPPYPTTEWARRQHAKPRRRITWSGIGCTCLPFLFLAGVLAITASIYLLSSKRTNILLLGLDWTPYYSTVGRSDTIILTTFVPKKPYVGMLSIPRDLWVNIPGSGENRINTAHFFGEAQQVGTGPLAAMDTVRTNFGVNVDFFVRIRFDGFRQVIDAMGGVDIILQEPAAGYEPGRYHLNGNKALAFARYRMGSDDFFRMEHAQLLMKSALKQLLSPAKWLHIPAVIKALKASVDTDVPAWLLPRLGFALLRLGPDGIDNRTITREMTTQFITNEGADVLAPNWARINPVLQEIFTP